VSELDDQIEVFQTVPDDLRSDPVADLAAELEGRGPSMRIRHAQWGHSVDVVPQAGNPFGPVPNLPSSASGAVSWQTLVLTPTRDQAVDWSITVAQNFTSETGPQTPANGPQATFATNPVTLGTANSPGLMLVRVTYTLGESTFVRGPFIFGSILPERFHVVGRRVQVDVAWALAAGTTLAAAPLSVSGGAAECGVADSPLDHFMLSWNPYTLNTPQLFWPAPTRLAAYQAILQTMSGDAQLYLGFADEFATRLVSTSTPLKWSSPPFTAALQWYAFAEGQDEKIVFNKALTAVLSSTPDVYTTPVNPVPQARIQIKQGP
jgi:hypothetical protein